MIYLKLTSEATERFRKTYPDYWQDYILDKAEELTVNAILIKGTHLAILRNEALQKELIIPGLNIVTSKGVRYYAEKASGTTLNLDFNGANNGLRLGSGTTTPTISDNDVTTFLSGTSLVVDATYPKSNDGDTDNTGAGVAVITWRYSYTASQGIASNIAEGALVDNKTTPTGALTHFLFPVVFSKTGSDTLKVIVNSSLTGVVG